MEGVIECEVFTSLASGISGRSKHVGAGDQTTVRNAAELQALAACSSCARPNPAYKFPRSCRSHLLPLRTLST